MDTEWEDLILDSRLTYALNMKTLYFLVHCQRTTVAEATRALKTHRANIYGVLEDNPLFLSERRPPGGWATGGTQRCIILSEAAKAHLEQLTALAERRLGPIECQHLRIEASRRRKEQVKLLEAHGDLKKDLATLQRLRMNQDKPGVASYPLALKTLARKHETTPEELEAQLKCL